MAVDLALTGMGVDTAIDIANATLQANTDRTALLPIRYNDRVPTKFCKQYDQEEYLAEIYKKLGIEILGEYDQYYYEVKLPQNFKVEQDKSGKYCVKDGSDTIVLKYRDVGPFYDRAIDVCEINIFL